MGMRVGEVVFQTAAVGGMVGLVFGLTVVLADRLLKGFSLRIFSTATIGMLLGLAAARLLVASGVLLYTTEQVRWIISIGLYSTFGYLGTMLAVRGNRDEFALLIPYVRFQRAAVHDAPLVVDTSVLIDGRLPGLCQTGFLSSTLAIPRFVLEELQRLADSAEPLKRERGRRGLDLLNDMQRRPEMSITVSDFAPEGDPDAPVDRQLILFARYLRARLLTLDANLARMARLEGVAVLHLQELSQALSLVLATGEELELVLIKPGRDAHQAVGYLPDGGMVVVNHARGLIGQSVEVVVAGVLQTSAGRMYFAELKNAPAAPVAKTPGRA